MDVKGQEDFKGWYEVQFTNSMVRQLVIEHVIKDTNGHIIFLVSSDKTHYNFNNVISIREVGKK